MTPVINRRRDTVKGHGKGLTVEPKEIIINNTSYTLKEVRNFERYGGFLNAWRQRYVDIYQPPVDFLETHPNTVITVGHNYESNTTWICIEPWSDYSARILGADWSTYL